MVPEARPEKSLEMGGALDSRDHQHSEIGALFTRRGSSERKLNIDYKHDKQKTRKHHEGQTILGRVPRVDDPIDRFGHKVKSLHHAALLHSGTLLMTSATHRTEMRVEAELSMARRPVSRHVHFKNEAGKHPLGHFNAKGCHAYIVSPAAPEMS